MSWAAPSGHTWVTGEVVTAGNFLTYIYNNLIDLDRRTTVTGASVLTSETTTSTSYAALATPGPLITVQTGAACLVGISLQMRNSTGANESFAAFDITGANTSTAASDANNRNLRHNSVFAAQDAAWGAAYYLTLIPGISTFTMKYRVGGGTGTFLNRYIWALPMAAA